MRQRLAPFLRLASIAAIVAGAAAWAHPRAASAARASSRAQVCRGGAYTLIVEAPSR